MASLSDGWGIEAAHVTYLAVGGGSYHWVVAGGGGTRYFITVDDLDRKGYLGPVRDSALEGLRRAFGTALALRDRGGLEFVLAPMPAASGEIVRRLGQRYSIAVFPFVEGTSRAFKETPPPEERAELVRMLVRLHQATPLVESAALPANPRLPGRALLEEALADLDAQWSNGPFAEAARMLVTGHVDSIRRRLESFDRLCDEVLASGKKAVITHGEPHPGNLVLANGRLILVDWDTAGLAPPERDLWSIDSGSGRELQMYEAAAGHPVDQTTIALYRLRWELDDMANFLAVLRSPHERNADTEHAWRGLVSTVG